MFFGFGSNVALLSFNASVGIRYQVGTAQGGAGSYDGWKIDRKVHIHIAYVLAIVHGLSHCY